MKKLFTILAMAWMAVGAYAQVLIAEKDWTGCTTDDLMWYQFDDGQQGTVEATNEGVAITISELSNMIWEPQTMVLDGATLEEGHTYIVRITAKIPNDGQIQVNMGRWGENDGDEPWEQYIIDVIGKKDFQTIEIEFPDFSYTCDGNGHVLFQNGFVVGTCVVKKVEISEPIGPTGISLINNGDLEGSDNSSFFERIGSWEIDHYPVTISDGVGINGSRGIRVEAEQMKSERYDNQFWVRLNQPISEGTSYRFSFNYRADIDASVGTEIHGEPGDYIDWEPWTFYFETGWQTFSTDGIVTYTQSSDEKPFRSIAFDLSTFSGADNYYFDNVKFEVFLDGQCPKPTFTLADNVMSIQSPFTTAIYYTLDGSTPTTASLFYISPLVLSHECTVKAIAIVDGKNVSPVATYYYSGGDTPQNEVSPYVTDNGIFYDLKSDGTLEVVGLATSTTIADIPSSITVNGTKYSVTSIGSYAFEGRDDITYLSIPWSVTSIGEYAFRSCGSNMTVNIADPESWCQMQLGNEHSSPLSSAGKMLVYDIETTSFTVPEAVTSIGAFTFYQCSCIKSLYIPASVTSIGSSAFEDCDYLVSVTLSEGLQSIGGSTFEGCKRLESLTIPSTVTSIALNAFNRCTSLNSITSEIRQPFAISEDVFCTYSTATLIVPAGTKSAYQSTAGWNKFANIVESTSIDVIATIETNKPLIEVARRQGWISNDANEMTKADAENVTDLGLAFENDNDITSLDELEYFTNLKSIAQRAFYGCNNLKAITIPKNVTDLGDYHPLTYCINLISIKVSDENTQYDSRNDCNAIIETATNKLIGGCNKTIVPNTVSDIGDVAFSYCSDMTSLMIPEGVKSIGRQAFWECSGLKSIQIPASVTKIGKECFVGCISIESMTVAGGNAIYDSRDNCNAIIETSTNELIEGCAYTVIPISVLSIGEAAFAGRKTLRNIEIPNSITAIGENAFYGCSELVSISIPANVKSIGETAFEDCTNLKTVFSYVQEPFAINENVFIVYGGDQLYQSAKLYIPYGTISAYQSTAGWSKFNNIIEQQTSDNTTIDVTIDEVIYSMDPESKTATIKQIVANYGNLVIPENVIYNGQAYTVTNIGRTIFNNENDLFSIEFPSTITSVESGAFSGTPLTMAMIWNSDLKLSLVYFDDLFGANFVLYVKKAELAPGYVPILVVDGVAGDITLDESNVFKCPKDFTANSVSFTHNYQMQTFIGECAGWETISLPFDVQTITHETKGELVPFANHKNDGKKPFWLYSLSSNGFVSASEIKANTPYIISMPNNDKYSSDYNLAGSVTFKSYNATVHSTSAAYWNSTTYNGATFRPSYSFYPQQSGAYTINATNDFFIYQGSGRPGSEFVNNSRQIRPFEAWFWKFSANTRTINIEFAEDNTTGLKDILIHASESSKVVIHSLNGQLVERTNKHDFDQRWQSLPKGVYIVNGKKLIK